MSELRPLFIPTLNSGVSFWRLWNFVNAAFRNRIMNAHMLWWQKDMTDIHPWQSDIVDNRYRARILGEVDYCARQADVVVMGMVHSPAGLDLMMSIREAYGIPVAVEMDDNILSTPNYNPAAGAYDPQSDLRKICIRQMREADALIVSTPYLKEIYSEFNDNIYVMPNSIDFDLWGKAQRKVNKGKITIGWAGGASHNDDLKIIEPVIEYIAAKHPRVEFRFLHGISPALKGKKGVKWVSKFARSDQYPNYVAQNGFDIGIAPLVDNAFNRGKSNLRWLENAALSTPVVASNVGHFKETIRHGEDGLLCDTADDFIYNLEQLINDKSMRKEIGRNAYARAFKDFNVDINTLNYATILEEIKTRGQIKRASPEYKNSNHVAEAVTEDL